MAETAVLAAASAAAILAAGVGVAALTFGAGFFPLCLMRCEFGDIRIVYVSYMGLAFLAAAAIASDVASGRIRGMTVSAILLLPTFLLLGTGLGILAAPLLYFALPALWWVVVANWVTVFNERHAPPLLAIALGIGLAALSVFAVRWYAFSTIEADARHIANGRLFTIVQRKAVSENGTQNLSFFFIVQNMFGRFAEPYAILQVGGKLYQWSFREGRFTGG